jgi:hypothetical protein
MPSSAKVHFKLETLKAKALESIDHRIAMKQIEVNNFEDDEVLERRVRDWRNRQEARISELFSRLGEGGIDNHQLSEWEVEDIPKLDKWDRQKAVRELRGLEATRSQIVAKSDSLVADDKGEISLTSTQLKDFFDL